MSSPNWWGDWRPTLTPHTGNLQATDLIECTSIVGGLPVNTAITGAQIIAAASSGATWGSITGTLSSQTDLQTALNAKQDTLVSATNIKTINGNSILGSGNLTISGSNIYNADGTLTTARTLTQGGFDLTIAGTTSSRFFSNGNVGIGTTTNAGFKLDVNGTARVSGALTLSSGTGVASSISYGSTYGLLVYGNTGSNSDLTLTDRGGNLRLRIVNGGNILQTATTINDVVIGGLSFTAKSIYTSSVYGLVLGGSAGSTYHFSLFESTGTNGFFIDSAGRAKVGAYNSVYNNSAILEAVSTTRGFLPPRMTNAQMLAIAAPAAGLVVYDTTNNKHCGYNGTAWQNFY